mmetsp:Transcript_86995/g.186385  ORF Transcript_86995/g.186385 Transcript_86995/m.186385 type:complete len:93 (+) Transcript_86995:338-616(+)
MAALARAKAKPHVAAAANPWASSPGSNQWQAAAECGTDCRAVDAENGAKRAAVGGGAACGSLGRVAAPERLPRPGMARWARLVWLLMQSSSP